MTYFEALFLAPAHCQPSAERSVEVSKQQLRTCITLFCTYFLCRHSTTKTLSFIDNVNIRGRISLSVLSLNIFLESGKVAYSMLVYEQSLFFLGPSSKKRPRNANDHTRDWRRETGEARQKRVSLFFLACRGFAAQRSRPRALPLVNLKKMGGCSQSNSMWSLVRTKKT